VFGSSKPSDYENGAARFLEQIAGLVALAISNLLTRQAVAGEEEKLRALTALSIQLSERSIRAHHVLQAERARLETILEINAALAATKLDMQQMFPAVSKSLARAVSHDTAVINLWNEERRSYVVFAEASNNGPDFAPSGMVLPSGKSFTAQVLAKKIDAIPGDAMEALEQWHWPGNIRELENFLERSVILTAGTSLRVPVGELCNLNADGNRSIPGTLEELERQYILQVLRQVGGVISGSDGAAAKLGMKRTTLQSKMLRLGISKEDVN
jgi:hypothetical protein